MMHSKMPTISHQTGKRIRFGTILFCGLFSISLIAACGAGPGNQGIVSPTQTAATITPTATIDASCADFVATQNSPALSVQITLPPNTIIGNSFATHGEGQTVLCTQATQAAIDAYMHATLPSEGWRPYDPSRDANHECLTGTLKWVKGNTALNWAYSVNETDTLIGPPRWVLLTCGDLNQP